jgi:tRNA U34 5-methylaminomethyl-2-thiouridine-forming methyltransferase MnmC
MEEIITNDGSSTFYNEEFDDIYHSKSGAVQEAIEKYAKPAIDYLSTLNIKKIKILDICFGLGYNSCAIIDLIKKYDSNIKIEIIALEKDLEIINKILLVNPNFESYKIIKKLAIDKKYDDGKISIKLLIGDAFSTIELVDFKANIVFHDPFSPSKQFLLWQEDFFLKVRDKMVEGGRLFTYSCSRKIRNNLINSKFLVIDGPIVGRKSPSTIAINN